MISSVPRQIAFKMLKLLRALCLICFLLSAILLIASFADHRLFKHPILIPTITALTVSFLVWYLLPVFLEKMESTSSNIDHMKPLRMENAALKLEIQRLNCLYDEFKERFFQKDKMFRKSNMVFAVIARSLVNWEQSNGRVSAQDVLFSLREELRRLNIEEAEKEDM